MATNVKPNLTVLSADNIQQVHETALTILEKTGIRVDDPNARRVFKQAVGGKVDQDRFLIPGELVEWAIKTTPSKLTLYCRDGKPGFRLDSSGTERTVFGIGVTNLYYQEPLILNAETTIKLDMAVSKGLPVIFSNYGMSGATCPITPGGTLALLTAELLAGLTYCQLLKEGTPVVLGSLPAAFDMESMLSLYSPQSMLLNLACAEMMSHYRIPHCGTSGGSIGWGPDLMSGSILWANHLTSTLGTVGLVPFVGNNFDSLAFSPATVVYAAEIIQFSREFSAGFSLESEIIGLDEIISMGPGANYLTSRSTLKQFKAYMRPSRVWPMLSLEKWQGKGCPKAGEILRQHTAKLLSEISPLEDHEQLLSSGEEYIRNVCKSRRNNR